MLKFEWNVFRSTLMFLTRIPVGKDLPHDAVLLQHTPRYFALVGYLVGLIHMAVWLAAYHLWHSVWLATALAMVATIFTTGAFHEDGFADVCDGFGGGWTREKILEIMKDSRLGTFGTVGLLGILAVKLIGLTNLPNDVNGYPIYENSFWGRFGLLISTVVCGHGISRFMAVATIQYGRYAPDHAGSKSKPLASAPMRPLAFWLTAATALLPFLVLFSVSTWLALVPVAIARWWMYRFFHKWIQGYTGDCLGAIQQVTEVVFYLSVAIFWQWQTPISQLQL